MTKTKAKVQHSHQSYLFSALDCNGEGTMTLEIYLEVLIDYVAFQVQRPIVVLKLPPIIDNYFFLTSLIFHLPS